MKIKQPILFLLFIFISIFSSSEGLEGRFEIRYAAFRHSAKLFREIYGDVSGDFSVQAAIRACGPLEAWANIDWYSKKGKAVNCGDKTKVYIDNFSFGLNYLYDLNCKTALYAGLGPSFGYIKLKNNTPFGDEKVKKTIYGGVVKFGAYYSLSDNFYINLFIDYLYQPVRFDHYVNIGGAKCGAGLGVKF